MQNDPISDLLTRIRNAAVRKHLTVIAPYSKTKEEILKIFKEEGYIKSFSKVNDNLHKNLEIKLRYDDLGESTIKDLRRVSKPGLRVYANHKNLPKVLNGFGVAVVSTSHGLMTEKDAKTKKLGGEIICTIY